MFEFWEESDEQCTRMTRRSLLLIENGVATVLWRVS